jgi:hypothetical protein
MGRGPDQRLEAIRAALGELAAKDVPELIAQARADAQSRVRELLADAMTEAMLERARVGLERAQGRPVPGTTTPRRGEGRESGVGGSPSPPDPRESRVGGSPSPPHPRESRVGGSPSPPDPQESGIGRTSSAPEAQENNFGPSPSPPEPPDPATEGELGLYVYCIVDADALGAMPEQAGVDSAHPPTLLAHEDLAAVVSPVPLSDFGEERLRERLADMAWLEGTARRHEGVLEAIGEHATLIPMRLCTIYRSEQGLREMLVRERAALKEALAHLEHKSEWGVKVFASESDPAAARAEEHPPPDGTAYMRRRRDARDQREQRAQEHHYACTAIHDALAAVAADAITNPPQRPEVSGHSGEMLLNGVYLVEDDQLSRFLDEVGTLREGYERQGLELEPTGPWPAYNFVPGTIGAAW